RSTQNRVPQGVLVRVRPGAPPPTSSQRAPSALVFKVQRFLQRVDRADGIGRLAAVRKDSIEPAAQRFIEKRLVRSACLRQCEFHADRILDPLKRSLVEDSDLQELLAKLDQSPRRGVRT